MKRRDFITRMAVAPLFVGGGWRASAMPESLAFGQVPKRKCQLPFSASEQKLVQFLATQADECHLFGAPVMAKLCGAAPAWLNILGGFDSFSRTKRALFTFGVEPVSTPEMPTSFVKFRYEGRVYNVMDGSADSFCQSAYFSARQNRLPFAHGFLLFNARRGELHDPCGAAADAPAVPFKLISQPPTPVDAFDWLLSGWFECRFLGIKAGGDLPMLEAAALDCDSGKGQERFVAERVMNYFPEIIDYLGAEVARKVAGSRIVRHAMNETFGIDFEKVYATFERSADRGRSSGAQFMGIVQNQMGEFNNPSTIEGPVCRFMAQNNFTFRRPEWLVPGAESPSATPAGIA